MSSDIHFETPENVRVSYQIAGLGTRFIAWLFDNILLWILAFVILIILLILGASLDIVAQETVGKEDQTPIRSLLYLLALFWLAFSLGSLLYFGLSELLMRGQTLGKRWMEIRVVKADGFSLDPTSIFVRSFFRVVDHLPPLWIVPLVSQKGQRLGDLVAGTVVVSEQRSPLNDLRQRLMERPIADCRFRFDAMVLKRARPQDVRAVEQILERWGALSASERANLLTRLVVPLASRLQVECPADEEGVAFLHDFLTAEYRRQYRKLG